MKKVLAALLSLTMVFALTACGGGSSSGDGKVKSTIILVLEDESEVKYEIEVAKDSNLRDALLEAKLITEEEHGNMFIKTIDKYTADFEGDPARTWSVQDENRKSIEGFFEEITVEDGKTYYLVNTLVPNFDD